MSSETQPTYLRWAAEMQVEREKGQVLRPLLTFDDVIILPGRSIVKTPDEVDTSTTLVPGIRLAIPVISSNMASVTGDEMAIAMALNGGIGALHREQTVEEQAAMVRIVKERHRYIIDNPARLSLDATVAEARERMATDSRGYVLVFDGSDLQGIATTRDVSPDFIGGSRLLREGVMTEREQMVVASPDISIDAARRLMWKERVEKVVIIDGEGNVGGVITDRDIREMQKHPKATRDQFGRLQVLASVGVSKKALEDAFALEEAGADGIIVDVLHGDSPQVLQLIKDLKSAGLKVPVIAGNVGTGAEVRDLFEAGADNAKVGYGVGSHCTTQLVTGTGSAQLTAVIEVAAVANQHQKQTIADGGIRTGGDITKAIAAGADAVMLGGLLAGTEQSPGEVFQDENGARYKLSRGSASREANSAFAAAAGREAKRRAPQGVSAVKVPFKGDVGPILFDLIDGLRHGIANSGGNDFQTFREGVVFGGGTGASLQEAQPHIISRHR